MTGPSRIAGGGGPLPFTFAGKRLEGQTGDSIASALLANGIVTVGRSFKYRRPRGILSADHQHGPILAAAVVLGVRHPRPHDLSGVGVAVAVWHVGDAQRARRGRIDLDRRG